MNLLDMKPSRRALRFTLTAGLAVSVGLAAIGPAAAQPATKELRNETGHVWRGAEVAYPGRTGTPKTAILLNADGSQGEVIDYVDFGGEAVVDGDILLHVDERGFASFDRRRLDRRPGKSAGRTADSKQWPGGIVPFTIASGVSTTARGWIAGAMAAWQGATSLRFVPRTDEVGYLYFTTNDACSSSIGYQGGKQNINVNGCWQMGNAIHEIGHAIGLYHEQTRRDRESHVEIVWDNIVSSSHNFKQYSAADGMDLTDYDYGSIMHYGCWAFTADNISYNTSTMSIKPNNTDRCYTNYGTFWTGQRNQLSDDDIAGVNQLYPEVRMLAMNSAGNIQGNVLYAVGASDATTHEIGALWGPSPCVTDMDFLPGTAFIFALGCEQPGAGSSLLRVDEFLRLPMPIATLNDAGTPRLATSLAVDPITGELYAIDYGGKGWGSTLLKIELPSGLVTVVGALWGDHHEASSVAFSEGGKLFAVDNSNGSGRGENLFTIDIATAQTRAIGALNGDRTGADTLRFGANGTLYGSRRNNSDGTGSVLFLINTEDASTRDIDFFHGDRTHATSMAIRNTGSPSPDYKMVAMNSAGHSQGTVLYEVDAGSVSTTDIGSLGPVASCATDIDYLPDTPLIFGIGCEASGGGSSLFHYHEGLGAFYQVPVNAGGALRLVTSIAFDAGDELLYAIGRSGRGWGRDLFTIQPVTGWVTDIGSLWGDRTEASSIAFDPDGKKLYGIDNADNVGGGDVLFEIDVATGETTDIGPLTGSRTRAVTLRFAPDGTLYGTRRNNSDGTGSVLFLIDPEDATTRDVRFFHGDRTHATSMAIRRR